MTNTSALAARLWALHDVATEFATLWNRKTALEAAIQPVPRFGGGKARAHNAAVEAELAQLATALETTRARYDALGGTGFYPSDYMVPATVRGAAMALEAGRATTVRGAIEVAIDAHHDREDAAMRRRVATRQRATDARMARAAQHEAARNAQQIQWAAQDVAREIRRL